MVQTWIFCPEPGVLLCDLHRSPFLTHQFSRKSNADAPLFFRLKIIEKSSKISLKSGQIYDMGFEHILAQFLAPKMVQKRANGTPKPSQEAPGAPQETPQTTQRGPMEAHGGPWGAQGMPLGTKSGHVGHIWFILPPK